MCVCKDGGVGVAVYGWGCRGVGVGGVRMGGRGVGVGVYGWRV